MPFVATLRQVWGDAPSRWVWWACVLAHFALAFGFHLSPDEAHYALFSVHPQWSYFDHPPLSGWLQWPFAQLGGNDLLMRIVPMACWALGALGLMVLTALLYPTPQTGGVLPSRVALILWALSPMAHLLGIALVPDTLLIPITCAVMMVAWRLCDASQVHRLSLWLALGASLGLAGLSKYTAVLIGVGAILVLLRAHGPRLLTLRGPWLALLVAGLFITPVLGWNAANQWISLAYQFGHAKGVDEWRGYRVAVFGIVQWIVYGLLPTLGILAALWFGRARPVDSTPNASRISPALFCACFGLPTLALLLMLSGRGATLPHWSITAWLALTPWAAWGAARWWERGRKTLGVVASLQAFTFIALATLMLWGGKAEQGAEATSLPGNGPDTADLNHFADLHGWDAAATRAVVLAEQHKLTTLAVMNWTLDGRIAWYARPLPVKVVQRHLNQFGLWFGVLQPKEDVLLLDWSQVSFKPPVGPAEFERCDLIEQLPTVRLGRQIAHFNFLVCRNWQGPLETVLERR
jgi:4-amino-4-deoxy-L-arabinose transferase-like glycosyltransferase